MLVVEPLTLGCFKRLRPHICSWLISTKRPELEEHDAIKERYEQAKAVVGENIALSPQCGFASVEEGNCIDEETQWKKIDLLVSCQDFI